MVEPGFKCRSVWGWNWYLFLLCILSFAPRNLWNYEEMFAILSKVDLCISLPEYMFSLLFHFHWLQLLEMLSQFNRNVMVFLCFPKKLKINTELVSSIAGGRVHWCSDRIHWCSGRIHWCSVLRVQEEIHVLPQCSVQPSSFEKLNLCPQGALRKK